MGIYKGKGEPKKDHTNALPEKEVDLYSIDSEDTLEDSGIGCRAGTLHVVRVSIGTGILFMPYTMMRLGYIMGATVFIVAGIVYYYVARMALYTETKMGQQLGKPYLSYVELASHVFHASPFPFNKCASLVKYFICVFYSIPFANSVILVVMRDALHKVTGAIGLHITPTIVISVLIVPLTIFCLFQRILKILVPYSSVTNVITAGLAVSIVIVSIVNGPQSEVSKVNTTKADSSINKIELADLMVNKTEHDAIVNRMGLVNPKVNETAKINQTVSTLNKSESIQMKAFGDIKHIPTSLAMYMQVFSCTSLLFAMKSDMPKPKKLTKSLGILNVAGFLVMVVHYFFGFSLYMVYGNRTKSDVLENLSGTPKLIVNSLFCLTLFVSYILCFFARFNNVWTNTIKPNFKNEKYANVVEFFVRVGYNLFAFFLAITIPNFKLVSAFAGSLTFIVDIGLSSLIVVLYRVTYRKNNFWVIVKNGFIIGMCLVLFGATMNKNVNGIISFYSKTSKAKNIE